MGKGFHFTSQNVELLSSMDFIPKDEALREKRIQERFILRNRPTYFSEQYFFYRLFSYFKHEQFKV